MLKAETISAAKFKAHCLKIMNDIKKHRKVLIVTKHGKPIAQLTPIYENSSSAYGCMADVLRVKGDIVSATHEVWSVEKD